MPRIGNATEDKGKNKKETIRKNNNENKDKDAKREQMENMIHETISRHGRHECFRVTSTIHFNLFLFYLFLFDWFGLNERVKPNTVEFA